MVWYTYKTHYYTWIRELPESTTPQAVITLRELGWSDSRIDRESSVSRITLFRWDRGRTVPNQSLVWELDRLAAGLPNKPITHADTIEAMKLIKRYNKFYGISISDISRITGVGKFVIFRALNQSTGTRPHPANIRKILEAKHDLETEAKSRLRKGYGKTVAGT